jgi:ribosomal protein S30
MKKDRLFVPLCTEYYTDFKNNRQKYELRVCKGNFAEKFVYTGRKVELRKGYSGENIFGEIGKVIIGSLKDVLNQIDYKNISPRAKNSIEFVEEIKRLIGETQNYIAFEVLLKT